MESSASQPDRSNGSPNAIHYPSRQIALTEVAGEVKSPLLQEIQRLVKLHGGDR
jgi:hypothetical protein